MCCQAAYCLFRCQVNLNVIYQPAYSKLSKLHSTETALKRVYLFVSDYDVSSWYFIIFIVLFFATKHSLAVQLQMTKIIST